MIDFFLEHPDFNLHFEKDKVNQFLCKAFFYKDTEIILKLIKNGISSDSVSSSFTFAQDSIMHTYKEEEEALLKGMKDHFYALDLKDDKIIECLFKFWLNPLNMRIVDLTGKEWNHFLDALSSSSIAKSFPNLFTLIINRAIELNVPLEKISKCLDIHPNLNSYQGKQLLYKAIENGNFFVVKELIKRGVNPNTLYGLPLFNIDYDKRLLTPLHHAIISHKKEIAEFLLYNKIAPVSIKILNGNKQTIF